MSFDVVLRVAAVDFDVAAFFARHPALRPSAAWRKGRTSSAGRIAENSGFNCSLASGDVWNDVWAQVREELLRLEDALDELKDQQVPRSLDVGVFVDVNEHFALCSRLSAADLARLADLGLELEVSSYACAEDEPSSEEPA